MKWTAIVTRDYFLDGTEMYLAEHPDLLGCMAQGRTVSEALSSLDDARNDYLEDSARDGIYPIPPIKIVDVVIVRTYSI